jgi:hypothetical protein
MVSALFFYQLGRSLWCGYASCSIGTGYEFSRVHTRLTLGRVETKSGSRVWCRQKNAWHAGAAWRMAGVYLLYL